MGDNELLARWLGWEEHGPLGRIDLVGNWMLPNKKYAHLPDFRASNEWAGALLSKLGMYGCLLHTETPPKDEGPLWYVAMTSLNTEVYPCWRDAVVDAALVLAKKELTK